MIPDSQLDHVEQTIRDIVSTKFWRRKAIELSQKFKSQKYT